MQIDIPDPLAEKIRRQLAAAGIKSIGTAESIEYVLEWFANSQSQLSAEHMAQQAELKPAESTENALDMAKRLGLLGAFEGPNDLSTNPDHMLGFGQ